MRDMNILNEIDDFKRLSGLLTESPGGVVARLRRVPWIDELLTPAVRATDSETGRIASKIDRGGLRSLTDDELLFILKKLPAEEVANKLIKKNVFFSEAQVNRNLQGFLNDLTQGNKTWDEIEQLLTDENSLRQLWGQSASPMTDDVYEGLEDILNEVGQKYLDDIEDFIRKNGSDSAKAKLPKQGILSKLGVRAKQKLNNTFLSKQRFIINVLRNTTTSVDKLADEADVVFTQIKKKMASGGNNYVDISSEVRKLTELATAANKVGDEAADEIFNNWVRKAGLSSEELRKINKDKWKKEWLDAIDEYAKDDSFTKPVRDYVKAYSRLLPGTGKLTGEVGFRNFAKRWANMVVYATPFKRKEIIGRLTNKGVQRVVASRIAGNIVQSTLIVPTFMGAWSLFKNGIDKEDQRTYLESFKDGFFESIGIFPITITYLDDLINKGVNGYEYLNTHNGQMTAEEIGGEVWADYQEAETILRGEGAEIDKNQLQKTKGVQRYVEREYPDFPYTKQIIVTSNNKVVFLQKTDAMGTINRIPVELENGKLYLINKQSGKRVEFSRVSPINEGLIKIIKEQYIDWSAGEDIEPSDDRNYDDITTSNWVEVLGSGESNTENGTGSSLGLTLPNIGGGSSRQSKVGDLILSSNTESINIAKKEAKEDADEYTKDHISIESASTSPTNKDRVVLVGKTLEKDDHFFPVEKGPSGKYGWINNDPDSGDNEWNDFTEY